MTPCRRRRAERLDRRLRFHFQIGKEGCEGKKSRRQKTLKTPFLRRAGESCGKILFRRCNLSRRKKLTNNSGIPQHEIENIARILLPDILAFYESEEGQREFAEWKAARDGAKTDKDSNGENVA